MSITVISGTIVMVKAKLGSSKTDLEKEPRISKHFKYKEEKKEVKAKKKIRLFSNHKIVRLIVGSEEVAAEKVGNLIYQFFAALIR